MTDDPAPAISRRDVLAAAAFAVLTLVFAASGLRNDGFVEGVPWPLWASVASLLVASASLAWRRRRPSLPLVVAGPLGLLEVVVGGQLTGYFLLFEAIFEPVMHGSRRLARTTTVLAVAAGTVAVGVTVALTGGGPLLLSVMMIAALMVSTPLLWGWEVRRHREARRGAESLLRLEHELAASRSAQALETERRRIAHDLHDVIAGHLSAVSLHTNLAASLPETAGRETSLATARDSAHAALRDLRSMIGVLATEEPGALPQATLDWPTLVARLRARDPDARVTLDPAVADPARVEPSVHAALLRLSAEAVTNAVTHGTAPITLDLGIEGEDVVLELRNAAPAPPRDRGEGVGRSAIVHRAQAVGGWAQSEAERSGASGAEVGGSRASGAGGAGAWVVRARLPARGHPVAGEPAPQAAAQPAPAPAGVEPDAGVEPAPEPAPETSGGNHR